MHLYNIIFVNYTFVFLYTIIHTLIYPCTGLSFLLYSPFRLGHIVFIEETVARRQVGVYVYILVYGMCM